MSTKPTLKFKITYNGQIVSEQSLTNNVLKIGKVPSAHLQLAVLAIHPGNEPHIVLPEPVRMEDGRVQSTLGSLGQSVGVLVNAR